MGGGTCEMIRSNPQSSGTLADRVNRVVPAPEVLDTAITLADEIAANSPLAVRNSRRMVREAGDLSETEAWARSSELSREVFASPDSVEGATAFAEKRPPVWRTS